jgi:hypothetical protein
MRPKTALLHIGTPKTGTTSIQRWLAHAQEEGSLAPVSYPLWGDDHNHQRLMVLYKPYEDLSPAMRHSYSPGGRRYMRMRQRYREFLFSELRTASAAVLSAESASDRLTPPLIARLREDLESVGFRECHIVLYVRDPADFFLSRAQQELKMAVRSFDMDPATFRYDFLGIATTWEHAFPGRLIVRKFPTDPGHSIIDDFAAVMQQCLGVTPPQVPLRMNTTYSAEAMQILQDYRETFWPDTEFLTPDTARLIYFLGQSRQDVSQTKPVLKNEVAEQIRANHKADAELLHSRYGVDLGLRNCTPTPAVPRGEPYRVDEILESIDPEIVRQLLLRLASIELGRKRSRPMRVAARAYHRIPAAYRPVRAAAWARSRVNRGKSLT